MGNVLESSSTKNRSSHDGSNLGEDDSETTKDWGTVTVPYLPRVKSFKRRRINSLPVRPKSPMRVPSLNEMNSRQRAWRRSDYFYPEMIPEPDYSDEGDSEEENVATNEKEKNKEIEEMTAKHDTRRKPMAPRNNDSGTKPPSNIINNNRYHHYHHHHNHTPRKSEDGLVVPKKPPNPYIDSEERKKLCKELKFNQKYGNFNSKSELQIALDRYKEDKARKNMATRKNSLEKILEQQAKKIEMQEKERNPRRPAWIDRLQEQQDPWIADPRTQEFYQVHAKVMSNQSSSSPSSLSNSDTSSNLSDSETNKTKTEETNKDT